MYPLTANVGMNSGASITDLPGGSLADAGHL